MTTLKATGTFAKGATPTLAVTGGAGNTERPEVHLHLRAHGAESDHSVMAWFDAEELRAAIDEAVAA